MALGTIVCNAAFDAALTRPCWTVRQHRIQNITIILGYNRHMSDELFGNGSRRGWPSFSLDHLYGWCPFVVAETKLNRQRFLLEYHCACVLEQELGEVEKRMGEEVFS